MPLFLVALLLTGSVPGPALAAALAFEQRGDDAQALAAVERLVRQDPLSPLPRLEAARLRLKGNVDLDLAQVQLEAARATAPENRNIEWRAIDRWATPPLSLRLARC